MELREACRQMHGKVEAFLAHENTAANTVLAAVQAQTRTSLAIIDEALEQYSLDQLALSYNGGKDCLVLLVLILASLHKRYAALPSASSTFASSTTPQFPPLLHSIYIECADPFPQVDAFVAQTSAAYGLQLARSSKPMKAALADYLAAEPQLRAVFVGTRRTDPHGAQLRFFDETDGDWPRFMRIHPVIDWHYTEIWAFLRELGIEYCTLYDQGYTSLGGVNDTFPNPALKKADGEGFRPAYELTEDLEERLGRHR
ncbi:putative FAD synthase [Ceratocystis lukuohia]|nr:putative FAD synthase [Ceratocystis fimbriata CBS 114723]